jgi:hypothetical protein
MATQNTIDVESVSARVQKAGLTVEQLREIYGGLSRPDLMSRARESGLTLEELRALLHFAHEHPGGITTSVTPVGNMGSAGGPSTQR